MFGLSKEENDRFDKDFKVVKIVIFATMLLIILIYYIINKIFIPKKSPCLEQKEMLSLEIKGVILEKKEVRPFEIIIRNPLNKVILYKYGQINDSIWDKSKVADSVFKIAGENKIILKGKRRTKELNFLNLIDSCE